MNSSVFYFEWAVDGGANAVFGPMAMILSATLDTFSGQFPEMQSDTKLNNKEYSRELAPVSCTPVREHRMKKILLSASHQRDIPHDML
jgi:hypothetical protein